MMSQVSEPEVKTGIELYLPLVLCLISTFYLIGLIWVIQLIQYPLFTKVGEAAFIEYHAAHSNLVVAALSIPVLVQFGGAVTMLGLRPPGVAEWLVYANLVFTFGFWVITALMQIPLHGVLTGGYDAKVVQNLVAGNWLRTLWWTIQGGLLSYMLIMAIAYKR